MKHKKALKVMPMKAKNLLFFIDSTFARASFNALLYAFIFLMLNVSANVNIIAHFGGLVAGLVIGYLIAARGRVVRQKHKITVVR